MTTIFTYNDLRRSYLEFKNNLPKEPFERYTTELMHLRYLIQSAKDQGLEKDVFEYKKAQEETAQNLRNMGYTVKLDD